MAAMARAVYVGTLATGEIENQDGDTMPGYEFLRDQLNEWLHGPAEAEPDNDAENRAAEMRLQAEGVMATFTPEEAARL